MLPASHAAAALQTDNAQGHHANISPNREIPIRKGTSNARHMLVNGAYRFQVPNCHAVSGMDISHAPTDTSRVPRHAFSSHTSPLSRAV